MIEPGQISSTFLMCVFVICTETLLVFLYSQPQVKYMLSMGIPGSHLKTIINDHSNNALWLLFFSLAIMIILLMKFAMISTNIGISSHLWTRTFCELAILLILQIGFIKWIVLPVYAEKFELFTGKKFTNNWEDVDMEKKLWALPLLTTFLGVSMIIRNGAWSIIPGILFHSFATFITEAVVLYMLATFIIDFGCLFEERKENFFEQIYAQLDIFPIFCICGLCGVSLIITVLFGLYTFQFPFLFQVIITALSYGVIVYVGNDFMLFKNMQKYLDHIKNNTDMKDIIYKILKTGGQMISPTLMTTSKKLYENHA